VWLHAFVTSALVGGGWSASRSGLFSPIEPLDGRLCTGGGGGPEPVWTKWRRERSHCSSTESNPSRPVRSLHATNEGKNAKCCVCTSMVGKLWVIE
jgi:hypothetical protein